MLRAATTIAVWSFIVGGGVIATATAFEVYILFEEQQAHFGMPNAEYVADTFVWCGVYSVGISGLGLLLTTPLLMMWAVIHWPSFRQLILRHP
jgi:hypothetical protein